MTPLKHNKWYVEPEPQEETEGWLITYLDMITLLLVLLVAMLSLAGKGVKTPSVQPTSGVLPAYHGLLPHQAEIVGELGMSPLPRSHILNSLGITAAPVLPFKNELVEPEQVPEPSLPSYAMASYGEDETQQPVEPVEAEEPVGPVEPVEPAHDGLDELMLAELGDDIDIVRNAESISFRINSEILFSSAEAELSLPGLAVLQRLIPVFNGTDHTITVEGHTDSVPMRRSSPYPSNWELSGTRAGSVVRYMQANGITSSRLRAIGYADTRPLAENDSEKGRAKNRRVELVLEKVAPN